MSDAEKDDFEKLRDATINFAALGGLMAITDIIFLSPLTIDDIPQVIEKMREHHAKGSKVATERATADVMSEIKTEGTA